MPNVTSTTPNTSWSPNYWIPLSSQKHPGSQFTHLPPFIQLNYKVNCSEGCEKLLSPIVLSARWFCNPNIPFCKSVPDHLRNAMSSNFGHIEKWSTIVVISHPSRLRGQNVTSNNNFTTIASMGRGMHAFFAWINGPSQPRH